MNLKGLYEKKGNLVAEVRKMADLIDKENRQFSAEEKQAWEKVNKELDGVIEQVEVQKRADAMKSNGVEFGTKNEAVTDEKRGMALKAWSLSQAGKDCSPELRQAAEDCGLNLNLKELEFRMPSNVPKNAKMIEDNEKRALSPTTGASGGYLVPQGFVRSLEEALLAYGGMREVAEIMRTESGNQLPWPTANDTSNTGELVGEAAAATEADPTFGQKVFGAYLFSSKIVKVPVALIEDSAFDVGVKLGEMLGIRLGRIGNTKFTTGTGTAQPSGIITGATSGKTASSASAITSNELIDLFHSIDPMYRANGKWMMHDSTLSAVRQLKDLYGQYMWQPGMSGFIPDRLFGKEYVINQQMATITNSAKTVLFGDLSKYKIREVRSIRMRALFERYAEYDQVGYVAFIRWDGALLDAGTHPVKYLIQAS